ncbi:MAG: chromosome segregation protein SMC [Oscillospiraceae bacterium]|nr:chromosome segregation protein SMC [Oscillospiraceae bacterium]
MRLKALDIHGFKSFPDKTRLEFGPGITCVVGPNGSGKSNVADAMRWVLGEQSTRNLRGSRMEDVIFSGTGRRKQLGLAEVTLHLDNTDRRLPSGQDEVSVTRRLYRSGDSGYLINGKNCRLKDVHELFMDTGLGRDGYSMVGQGRIADLISPRSEQRRDMLEEAAGISQSRYRRAAAMHKLAQAEDNLVRLRDILLELESRVGPLKAQKEKAEKYLVLAERRKALEIGLALHTIARSVASLRELEHKITKLQTEYGLCERDLQKLEADIEALQEQSQQLTIQAEALRRENNLLEERALRHESDIAVLENTVQHNVAAAERIERDRGQAADSQQQLEDEMEAVLAEISALRLSASAKRQSGDAVAREIAVAQTRDSTLSQTCAALAQDIAGLTERLAEQQIAHSAARSTAAELRQRVEGIEQAERARQEQARELEEALGQAGEELARCRATVEEHQNTLQGYKLRAENRSAKAQESRRALDKLQNEAQQKQARVKLLEDLERNMEGYTGSVRAVMKESRRGSLRGLHGTLSQLISVEPDYTAAVETALGAALQFIVAETEDDGKRAIEFLKRSNAGRATFLPLNAIRPQEFKENGLERCAGFVAMADELLSCGAKYKALLQAQLGRTAVAEDMDAAIAIARQFRHRFRVVTLDGQIINAGGSMTGGSQSRGAGILSRGSEIAGLKSELKAAMEVIGEQSRRSKQLTEEAAAAEAAAAGIQGDLARALEEVIRQEARAGALEQRSADLRDSRQELEQEKNAAAQRILRLEDDQAAGGERSQELEAEKMRLETELAGYHQEREALEASRADLSQAEARQRLELLSIEKDVEAREEAAASLRQRKLGQAGRDHELLAEQESLRQANEEIAGRIEALREETAALRSRAEDGQTNAMALLARREEIQAQTETLRREEKLRAAQKEKLSGELARQEERRGVTRQTLDNAAAKLYDDYQLTPREAEEQGCVLQDPAKAQLELHEVNGKIRALGNINVDAVEEYREVSERCAFMNSQVEDIERSKAELTRLITELTEKMSGRFAEAFEKINRCFGETFVELFSGGQAQLLLEDPNDMLECGILIQVQPPGKNVQNLDLLSGGEKGLAAIALLFAILKTTPAPFCVFDEVEAALDDINVTRYARYVRRMTRSTQFILISHRRGTMEEADVLYGVTMQEEGVSKLLEMKTKEMAGRLGI